MTPTGATPPVILQGYRFSVYNRIARMVLEEKGVDYTCVEIDPFAGVSPRYLALNPFGRVPTLVHGTFTIFETAAIARYVDLGFDGPPLQPETPKGSARTQQVISIVDNYAYTPMISQVFSHSIFRPLMGEEFDIGHVNTGLAAARPVLDSLERIAEEGQVLTGHDITLADCHLAPVMDYFVRDTSALALLSSHACLSRWWDRMQAHASLRHTAPDFGEAPRARCAGLANQRT